MLKFALFLVVSCVALANTVSSNPLNSTPPPSLDSIFKEFLEFLVCNEEWKSKSGCYDKLPPGIMDSAIDYANQLTSNPEKLCCPAYQAKLCLGRYSEQAELCKKILPGVKKSLDLGVKDLTDKYHCQLESCAI